ncbi:MAG: BTAD domain-containing putative transcriptional regulator [Caldilineaceae bacterium]
MTSKLTIRLFGGFSVALNDQPIVGFRSAKARGLLAFLAAEADTDHPRARLATLLWGDLPNDAARTNLRIELSHLKKILAAHPALSITRQTVRLHSTEASIDVQHFRTGVADCLALRPEAQNEQLPRLAAGLERYTGEFLANFQVGDTLEFEDWQLMSREHLHEQAMAGLETLQTRYAQQARWSQLAESARRQLALVPWTETAHRHLMQALAAMGQVQASLAQYAQCRQILLEEMGVEPSLKTQDLAERLRQGRTATPPPRHNLAQQLHALVGRQAETAQLHQLVNQKRLVTLLGIGGVGKSRLALAVAQTALHNFTDGVWFVPLAHLEASTDLAERVALAIGAAVGFPLTNLQSPLAELTGYLAGKQMLLILDNWEHLLDAAEAVLYPLLTRTGIHILATSRTRLGMEGEATMQLAGLSQPEATALFVERARRRLPNFAQARDESTLASIRHICQQVDGLPLGIELAASWVEHYTVDEIGRSLAAIEIEPAQAQAVVSRHQSLGTVFGYSWQLLGQREQQVLARLSVFQGGFDRSAAAAVAGSGLSELSALISHSLVQRVDAGRYDLHPLIQEFARQKLPPQARPALHTSHSRYYLTTLTSTPRARWADELRVDSDNLRVAWQRAVQATDRELLAQAVDDFGQFSSQFDALGDSYRLFQDAAARLGELPRPNELMAQLLEWQWNFRRPIHGLATSISLLHRALAYTADPIFQAKIHTHLATTHSEDGQWEEAEYHFGQVEELTRQTSDVRAYISAVESRIHINAIHFRGDYRVGIARLQEMLTLLDDLPDPRPEDKLLRGEVHRSLALTAIRYGDYALSIRYAQAHLALLTELGFRQQRGWVLLDIALAEQFAGLLAQAATHNREALALAEEVGAMDDAGLLNANLCLCLRQVGPLDKALSFGLKGAEILRELGISRQEGQARNRVGHVLVALERWAEADAAYAQALEVWEPLQHPNRYEAVAGRGLTAWRLGHRAEALALAEEAIAFVQTEGMVGIVEPALLLLNCHRVFAEAGEKKRADWSLQRAVDWVETIAGRISDEAMAAAFRNRPDNQIVARLWAVQTANG